MTLRVLNTCPWCDKLVDVGFTSRWMFLLELVPIKAMVYKFNGK